MDQVEGPRSQGGREGRLHEGDVVQAFGVDELLREGEQMRVDVGPDHLAVGTDVLTEDPQPTEAPAAQVESAERARAGKGGQERTSRRFPDEGLELSRLVSEGWPPRNTTSSLLLRAGGRAGRHQGALSQGARPVRRGVRGPAGSWLGPAGRETSPSDRLPVHPARRRAYCVKLIGVLPDQPEITKNLRSGARTVQRARRAGGERRDVARAQLHRSLALDRDLDVALDHVQALVVGEVVAEA